MIDCDRVAVVVPAYNAESTLAAALDGALAQDGIAEIVVVDDGSRDGTLRLARSYEPRVRVLAGPNAGASAARNRGAAATTSPWLLFLDADDVLEPGTIAARLAATAETGADVVICDWRDLDDDGAGGMTLGPPRGIDWALLRKGAEVAAATSAWATTAAILYSRAIFDKIGGFRADLPVIQDARFLFDAAYHGASFVHAPHAGALYRVSAGSLSRRDPTRFWLDVLQNGEQIEALWRARGALSSEQRQALAGIYDHAARELLGFGHRDYFKAARRQRALGLPLPLHGRFAAPLAGLFGLRIARMLMTLGQTASTPLRRVAASAR